MVVPVPGDGLPVGATDFAGRKAHDLTYTSCWESGFAKRLQRRIDRLLGWGEFLSH
jgi:hypothetical protein